MDGADLLGSVGEDAGRPEGVAELMPALLELRGQATVQRECPAAGEGLVDGDQM
jgi:hypothetical protein